MTTETTETIMSAAPADLRSATAFAEKLEAETELAKAASLRNHAVSGGIIVGAIGMSAAACLFAWGSRNPSPEDLQMALAKLPPIEVAVTLDPDAKVKMADGGKVTLADGGEVTLADGGTVKIDPNSTINVNVPPIQLPDVKAQPTTVDEKVIKRELTVFSQVDLDGSRTVVTGWTFANGKATRPTYQFCYVARPLQDGRSERTEIAQDSQLLADANRLLGADTSRAFSLCTWWQEGKV